MSFAETCRMWSKKYRSPKYNRPYRKILKKIEKKAKLGCREAWVCESEHKKFGYDDIKDMLECDGFKVVNFIDGILIVRW